MSQTGITENEPKKPSNMLKVAICVFGCITHPLYRQQLLKIHETWGRQCENLNVPVYYFLGEDRIPSFASDYKYPARMVYLPGVKNDYLSASYKQNMGLKYILDNEADIDFIYVCGTDTYLNIDRLISFLEYFDPTYKLCIGGHYNIFDNRTIRFDEYLKSVIPANATAASSTTVGDGLAFFYGGAGFILTKAMLDTLYNYLDTMVGHWVGRVPPKFHGACDVCMAYYVHCLGGKFVRFYNRFFECNHRGVINISRKMGYKCICDCCSKTIRICDIISCHNMSLEDFDDLDCLLAAQSSGSEASVATL